MSSLHNISQRIKAEGNCPNSFYENNITLKQSQRSYKKGKLQTNILQEHIHKNPPKIPENLIQQRYKSIAFHNQVGFIPGMQKGWFNI